MSDLETSSVSTESSGLNFERISVDTTTNTGKVEALKVGTGTQRSNAARNLTSESTSNRTTSQKISIGYELAFSIPLDAAGLFPTIPGSC